MPALSTWPPFPGPDRPTTLDTDTQAFFDHLGGTFTTEVNALADYLANAVRPAYSVMAVFDGSATSDADPGAGKWRLNNATQNAATVVYADLADANGADMTAIIEAIDDSTSSTKGWLRFSVNGDRTKWLLAKVTGAVVTATGYRKIPITVIASSAASPMTNADEITVAFTPNGDKGDTSANAPWSNILSPAVIVGSPSTITFSGIPSGYANVAFDWDSVGLSTNQNVSVAFSSNNMSFSSPIVLTSASLASYTGRVTLPDYLLARGPCTSTLGDVVGSAPAATAGTAVNVNRRTSGAVTAVRFSLGGGATFDSGTITPRAV